MKKFDFLIVLLLSANLLCAQDPKNMGDNAITICWDTSASMENRNIEDDFKILDEFFIENKNVTVQLLLFNVDITKKEFKVFESNWNKLREELVNIKYNGATIFSSLRDNIKYSKALVFTDGQKLFYKDLLIVPDQSLIVNSSENYNHRFLERAALICRSRFINTQNVDEKSVGPFKKSEQNEGLKGTVYLDNKPYNNAKITLKGAKESISTDSDGNFTISANIGDTLLIARTKGLLGKMVPVADSSPVKVFLDSEIFFLEEATVIDNKLKQEMVSNGYFTYNRDQLGYEIATIKPDLISSIETSIGDVVRNKVSGVNVSTKNSSGVEGGLAQTEIRGRNSIHMNSNALVVVDGIPLERSDVDSRAYQPNIANFNYVDPGNIAEINVLKGLAATNQWGSQGANGVILITTKTALDNGVKAKEIQDQALLKNNVYNDSISSEKSPFLMSLESSKTLNEAYDIYEVLKQINGDDYIFHLDAFSYFKDKNEDLALKIISNLWEKYPDRTNVLDLLVTSLILTKNNQNAKLLNQELLRRVPDDINYQLSKAMILKANGETEKALKEFLALSTKSSVSRKISKTLKREIRNIVFQNNNQINISALKPEYRNNEIFKVRLVFEWNLPGAEFELQFVNPQNRYFDWKHTNTEDKFRLRDEIEYNYRLEEFEFSGDNVSGNWVINAQAQENFKNQNQLPLILKTTVYQNFGSIGQTKNQYITYFDSYGQKKNITTLNID